MARRPGRSATPPTPCPTLEPHAGTASESGRSQLARRLEQVPPAARHAWQQRMAAAVADIRRRINDGHEFWREAIGESMPLTIDEIQAAAVRFGLSSDAALAGEYTLADVTTLMVGKQLAAADALHDRMQAVNAEVAVRRAEGAIAKGTSPSGGKTKADTGSSRVKRSMRSAATTKIIAALIQHHRYDHDLCLNDEPIQNNKLAQTANVSKSTASLFFKTQFKSYAQYVILCRDKTRLIASLKMLNCDFAPHQLLKSDPGAPNHEE
jgi:hypothetical protein